MDPPPRQSLKVRLALIQPLERLTRISKFVKVCRLIQKRDRCSRRPIRLENLSDLAIDRAVKALLLCLSKARQEIFIAQALPNEHLERLRDLLLADKCAHPVQIANRVQIDSIINVGWKSST